MDNKALLVLERPWYSPSENPKQCSVLPIFQSIERLGEPISVYHASFFEREGFRAALQHLMGHAKHVDRHEYRVTDGKSR